MSVVTDVIVDARLAPAGDLPREHRILGRSWTPVQLHALAAKDRKIQQHVEHRTARTALAVYFPSVDTAALRSLVTRTMGTTAGTYWMVAALHLAELALAYPQLLTPFQYRLLLAPLEAAEAVPATHPQHRGLLGATAGRYPPGG
jgi:hypothetical protein